MGSKLVRDKVDVKKQDFLAGDVDAKKQTLIHVYEEHLEGDDQEKLESLKALVVSNESLQNELGAAELNLPDKHEDMSDFLQGLTSDQAEILYNAI